MKKNTGNNHQNQDESIRKEKFLEALSAYMGIVLKALEASGVSRSDYRRWLQDDETFKLRVADITEDQCDIVESKLLDQINQGNTTAIIFYLKTKGKDRGYTERDKLSANNQGDDNASQTDTCTEKLPMPSKNVMDRKVKNKKDYIIKMLKKQGKFAAEMSYQVEITARLLVQADLLADEVGSPDFKPVTVEKSREGNARESISALSRLYLETLRQAQRSLAALGMNTDSRQKMEQGDDGFNDFLNKFKDDE